MLTRRIGLAGLAAWVGCGGGGKEDEEGGFPRACDQSAIDGDCVEYTGDGWTEADVIENCTQQGFMIEACPEDGRKKRVLLTADGRQAYSQAMTAIRPKMESLRDGFTSKEFREALPFLRALRSWLSEKD